MHEVFITRYREDIFCVETYGPVFGTYGFDIFLEIEGLPRNTIYNCFDQGCSDFKSRRAAEQMGFYAMTVLRNEALNYTTQQAYFQVKVKLTDEIKRRMVKWAGA